MGQHKQGRTFDRPPGAAADHPHGDLHGGHRRQIIDPHQEDPERPSKGRNGAAKAERSGIAGIIP